MLSKKETLDRFFRNWVRLINEATLAHVDSLDDVLGKSDETVSIRRDVEAIERDIA